MAVTTTPPTPAGKLAGLRHLASTLGRGGQQAPRVRVGMWCSGAVVVWLLAAAILPNGAPLGVVLIGAILGSASALTAVGLVLIWRSARIVNFAVGGLGAATGLSVIRLHTAWGWPYPVALVLGVLCGISVGVIVELVVIRRFTNSPRLLATVATIGLAQLLGGVELTLPGAIFGTNTGPVTIGGFETPLSSWKMKVGAHIIDGNHVLIVLVVPLLVFGLSAFLKRSLTGTAIRAASMNRDWARLLGIDVGKLSMLTWGLAGGLAAATYLLQAPFLGTVPQAAAGAASLMVPLAAALIARMESMPVACAAAVALGSLDQVVRWNASRTPTMSDLVLLLVILATLLFRKSSSSRAADDDSALQLPSLDRMRIHVGGPKTAGWMKLAGVTVLFVLCVLLPQQLSASTAYTLSIAAVWALVAISTVIATGWTGQLSLGQFAIVGLSAAVAGNLVSEGSVDALVVLGAAIATGMIVAAIIGIPALRIRGPFLAIVTLALAIVVDGYVLNPNYFPDLLPDALKRPVLLQRWPLEREQNMLSLTLVVLALGMIVALSVRATRSGRNLLAVRDNSKAAEAQSVSSRSTSVQGFVLAGAMAGAAGFLHVLILHGVRLGSYRAASSVESFSATTIGGLSSLTGSVVAAFGLRASQDWMSPEFRMVAMGIGVLLVLWLFPAGIGGIPASVLGRIRARSAGRQPEPAPATAAAMAAEPAPADVPPSVSALTSAGVAALSSTGLEVSYGQLKVLFGVDISVERGEMLALLGTNGAGKSTWLKAVMGLAPSKGAIVVDGVNRTGTSTEALVANGVALMVGGKSTFSMMTVADHLRLAGWTRRKDSDADFAADLEEVHALFPSLDRRMNTHAGDMSGGEQQQLALAQTLLLRPRILLIDELSLGLAPTVVADLVRVLENLNSAGVTIVIVEQSVNLAMTLAKRAVFMEKGQVRYVGPTAELLHRPEILRSIFFEQGEAESNTSPDAQGLGVLHEAPAELGEVQLSCVGINKHFGGVVAVNNVSLSVRAGEIVGLIGQNGAGKSTLLDCLSGFHSIEDGCVVVRGTDVAVWAPFERARAGVGRSFQEARLFPSLTVNETLAVARERHVQNRSMVADALRQPRSWQSEQNTQESVDRLIGELGLAPYRHSRIATLSTGTRRIVELACLLAAEPQVLLLDEPSAGVAQRETEALGDLLRTVRDKTGAAVVIVEHDMALLRSLCDRLVAMDLGAVIAEGTPEDVLANPAVIESYLGNNSAAIERSGPGSPTGSASVPTAVG